MFVSTDSPFKSVVLADCRGSGNDDDNGCAIDWQNSNHCLKNCTRSRPSAIAPSHLRFTADGCGCLCAADLIIDGSGGHWAGAFDSVSSSQS